MRILRFLTKPIKLLMFLLMVAALIYFRSVVFHPDVNRYLNTAVAYVETQLDIALPAHRNNDKETIAMAESECPAVAELEPINDDVENVVDAEEPVADAGKEVVNDPVVANNSAVFDEKSDLIESLVLAIETVNKKVDRLAQARETTNAVEHVAVVDRDIKVPLTVEGKQPDLAGGDRSSATSAENAVAPDEKQILFMARQSFWNGEVADAEMNYQKLIAINDSNPDVHGEMGNVYYTQGKWKQAGQAYYQAAIRLLAQQNNAQVSNQVSYLLRVIQGLDQESAEKLRSKISG